MGSAPAGRVDALERSLALEGTKWLGTVRGCTWQVATVCVYIHGYLLIQNDSIRFESLFMEQVPKLLKGMERVES